MPSECLSGNYWIRISAGVEAQVVPNPLIIGGGGGNRTPLDPQKHRSSTWNITRRALDVP